MKRLVQVICFAALALVLFLAGDVRASAAEDICKDNEDGTVTITYDNKDNAKMKLQVVNGDKKRSYTLGKGVNEIVVPLSYGDGDYKFSVCKNITGNKYSIVAKATFTLEKADNEVFLHPSIMVDYEVTDMAVKKAEELAKKSKTEKDTISACYNYMVENFLYDYEKIKGLPSDYIPDIEVVFKDEKGICYDISTVLASMLRSQGIKAKLVMGYTPNVDTYHAWNGVYDVKAKKWITIDATYDLTMYQAKAKFKMEKSAKDYSDVRFEY